MRTRLVILGLTLLCGQGAACAQSPAQKSFLAIQRLAGDWRGTDSYHRQVRVRFRVVSGGSAVLSELTDPDRNDDMVTMFHLDGDRLMMTHYCGAGNQPRMLASVSPAGDTIIFDFFDATNLTSVKDHHMRRLVLRLVNKGQHIEEWTFVQDGRDSTDKLIMQRATM